MNWLLFSKLYVSRTNKKNNLGKLLRYFIRLKIGELTGHIYNKKSTSQSKNKDELISSMNILDNQIRQTLVRINIESCIDIEKKKGFENIGPGCLISPTPFGNLMAMTQGTASFYFPTKIGQKYLLKLSLLSIPKISGIIKFENKPIHYFSIATLNNYDTTIEIKPEYVKETLSKISISTSRHWSPKYLDKNMVDFPLGVAVRLIDLLSTSSSL